MNVLFEQAMCSHPKQPQMFEILRLTSQYNHIQSKCFQLSHHPVFSRPAPDSARSGTDKKQIRQACIPVFFLHIKIEWFGKLESHFFHMPWYDEWNLLCERKANSYIYGLNKQNGTPYKKNHNRKMPLVQASQVLCIYIWYNNDAHTSHIPSLIHMSSEYIVYYCVYGVCHIFIIEICCHA